MSTSTRLNDRLLRLRPLSEEDLHRDISCNVVTLSIWALLMIAIYVFEGFSGPWVRVFVTAVNMHWPAVLICKLWRWCRRSPAPGPSRKGPLLVTLIGCMGVGKTTLLQDLRKQGDWACTFSEEPVKKWLDSGILDAFYKDPKSMDLVFQMYALVTCAAATRTACISAEQVGNVAVITDTSSVVNLHVYGKANLEGDAVRCNWYTELWDMMHTAMPETQEDVVIYLKGTASECRSRIETRGRAQEADVSEGYLGCLVTRFEEIEADPKHYFGQNVIFETVETSKGAQHTLDTVRRILAPLKSGV